MIIRRRVRYQEVSTYLYRVITTTYLLWVIPIFRWEAIYEKPTKILPQG